MWNVRPVWWSQHPPPPPPPDDCHLSEHHTTNPSFVLKPTNTSSQNSLVQFSVWTLCHKELHNLYSSRLNKRLEGVGHLIRRATLRHLYRILIQKYKGKEILGRPTDGGENNIENAYTQTWRWLDVPRIGYVRVTAFVNTILNLRVEKGAKFEDQVMQCPLLEEAHLQSTVQHEKCREEYRCCIVNRGLFNGILQKRLDFKFKPYVTLENNPNRSKFHSLRN